MLAGDFQRKLRKLNKDVRIFCGDNDSRPASVFIDNDGEFDIVCAVDKNWLPEYPVFDDIGKVVKGGWRRVLKVLVQRKLVDRMRAERIFGTHLEYSNRVPPRPKYKAKTPIMDAMVKDRIPLEEFKKMKFKSKGAV